jgi:ornithine cyclodeaminase/alanine dehydrogenase-like protein (mu-crystallin family)
LLHLFERWIRFLKIYLWSRNTQHAVDLQSKYTSKLNNIEILEDLNDHRLQESDVICTCTASEEALIGLKQVKKGVHINGN